MKKQLFILVVSILGFAQPGLAMELTEMQDPIEKSLGKDLILAAQLNELEQIKNLIEAGADVNYATQEGLAALLYAAKEDPAICEFLIASGANVNCFNRSGYTPLAVAAACNNLEICTLLIRAGADVYHIVENNSTALEDAHIDSTYAIPELLVEKMLSATPDEKQRIRIFLMLLKRTFDRGSYYNLKNIFQHEFQAIVRAKYAPKALAEINKLRDGKTKEHLLQKYFPLKENFASKALATEEGNQ